MALDCISDMSAFMTDMNLLEFHDNSAWLYLTKHMRLYLIIMSNLYSKLWYSADNHRLCNWLSRLCSMPKFLYDQHYFHIFSGILYAL